MSGVAKSYHERQLVRRGDAQQLAQGGLVDGAHDAAAHALGPCGEGDVRQRDAGVGVQVAGNRAVLHDGQIHHRLLVGFGSTLLRRQIGGPLDQRMDLFHHLRALHNHQLHGLTVRAAGRQAQGLHHIVHHILRHRLLGEAAVGAAGVERFHNRHRQTLLYIKYDLIIAPAKEPHKGGGDLFPLPGVAAGHGQTQHQRDAHSQRHGHLEGGDAVGQ